MEGGIVCKAPCVVDDEGEESPGGATTCDVTRTATRVIVPMNAVQAASMTATVYSVFFRIGSPSIVVAHFLLRLRVRGPFACQGAPLVTRFRHLMLKSRFMLDPLRFTWTVR